MSRLVPLLLLVSPAVAAPVPKAAPAKNYFPLQVGHKWEYVRSQGRDTWVEEVTAEEEKNGATFYTVTRWWGERRGFDEIYRVDKEGVARVRRGSKEFDPPWLVVKKNVTAGDRWPFKTNIATKEPEGMELLVGQPEEVTVPAGTFTAVPITFRNTDRLDRGPMTYWYAADVGLVKSVIEKDAMPIELKAFTPAKEGKK